MNDQQIPIIVNSSHMRSRFPFDSLGLGTFKMSEETRIKLGWHSVKRVNSVFQGQGARRIMRAAHLVRL